MSETMRLVFTVSAAVFEMFITMIFCDTVLKTRKDFISKALYILLCTVISAAFWFIRISGENWIFNLAVSSVQILLFTLLFETEWIRRFFAVISYLVFSMISEVIANSAILFTDSLHNVTQSSESYVYTVMLSKLIKFVLILIVMLIVQKDSLKTNFKDYLCLIIVPFISILIITVITIGSDGKTVHSGLAENTAVCGILVINFIVYYLLNNIIRANEIRQKQVQMEKQFQFQEQKYQQASMSFKSISSILHDTNKHLIYLRECAVEGKNSDAVSYIDTAINTIGKSYKRYHTGFLVIDALVSNAYNTAIANHIKFRTDIKIQKDKINIERYDLSVTLGNLLDNAIEACMKITSVDDRYIDVNIHTTKTALVINIINSAPNTDKTGIHKSDKKDALRHGYGLGNVSRIAEKYGGSFTAERSESRFETIVILPLKDE